MSTLLPPSCPFSISRPQTRRCRMARCSHLRRHSTPSLQFAWAEQSSLCGLPLRPRLLPLAAYQRDASTSASHCVISRPAVAPNPTMSHL